MRQRTLFATGIVAIAAAALIGLVSCGTSGGLPMMGGAFNSSGPSISIDRAQQNVQSFLDQTGDRDLKIDELMEFDQNFYALIKEKSTGVGAFELLVNKSSGAVVFEPGPDMMWNTKYSMMGRGMMGGGWFQTGSASASMPVSPAEATKLAQAWLDQNLAGDSAGTPDGFYGYYTFHFEKDGKIAGMLSVNGYAGQVWLHTWHGGFTQARDFGG